MVNYIITSSCIWLIALSFYYLFLRRETFFHWNRIYLVSTCLLGLLLPSYTFSTVSPAAEDVSVHYFNRVVSAKDSMLQPVVTADVSTGYGTILWLVYAAGCIVMLLFFAREIFRIYQLYKNGTTDNFHQWQLIETGEQHTPFSWRNLLFISNRQHYSKEQLDIISRHEDIHYRRIHFADILCLSLFQIVFWFNPLVYIYKYLIRLTHEYEADSYKESNTETYGQFLIEQAIGNFKPQLLHTFSSSPLKNRIMMLTQKRSTQLKAIKYLAIVPVLLFSFVMISNAQRKLPMKKELGDGKFEYNGNVFETSSSSRLTLADTLQMKTSAGEQVSIMVNSAYEMPDLFNGEKVQDPHAKKCSMPVLKGNEKGLSHYLYSKYKTDFEALPDNEYEIHTVNFIIDKKGKVVFIERLDVGNSSVSNFSKLENRKPIPDGTKAVLKDLAAKMTATLLYDTEFTPGIMNGRSVHANYCEPSQRWKIAVRNGKAIITENND